MAKNQLKTESPISDRDNAVIGERQKETKKKKQRTFSAEPSYEQRVRESENDIETIIRRLNALMSDYEMMPQSFITPDLYQRYEMVNGQRVFVELEGAKKNKLITGWFTKAFSAIRDAEGLLGIKTPEWRDLDAEFMALIKKEDEMAEQEIQDELKGKRIADLAPNEVACVLKAGKKKAAFEYLDEKVVILKKLETLMRRLVDDLQALKYEQAA
ncbi:hypothetical protein HZB94_04750 [Candidatus Falkowbacteria bacterium]|nr:hypothetical protein [Candidatus Falkowbacteria bacterium]